MRQSNRRDALESQPAPEMADLSILQLRTRYSLASGGCAAAVNPSWEGSAELVSAQPLEKWKVWLTLVGKHTCAEQCNAQHLYCPETHTHVHTHTHTLDLKFKPPSLSQPHTHTHTHTHTLYTEPENQTSDADTHMLTHPMHWTWNSKLTLVGWARAATEKRQWTKKLTQTKMCATGPCLEKRVWVEKSEFLMYLGEQKESWRCFGGRVFGSCNIQWSSLSSHYVNGDPEMAEEAGEGANGLNSCPSCEGAQSVCLWFWFW